MKYIKSVISNKVYNKHINKLNICITPKKSMDIGEKAGRPIRPENSLTLYKKQNKHSKTGEQQRDINHNSLPTGAVLKSYVKCHFII